MIHILYIIYCIWYVAYRTVYYWKYLDERRGLKHKLQALDDRKKKQGDVMQRRKDALKRTLQESQIRSMLDAIGKHTNSGLASHLYDVLFTEPEFQDWLSPIRRDLKTQWLNQRFWLWIQIRRFSAFFSITSASVKWLPSTVRIPFYIHPLFFTSTFDVIFI